MIPAAVLNDLVCQAQADYDAALGFLIGTRDRPLPEADPTAAGARELVVPLLQRVCDVYLSRLEQVESIARGAEAEEREQARAARHARYDGFTPRGLEVCEHKCCPPAVCSLVGGCDRHDQAYSEAEIARFYRDAS